MNRALDWLGARSSEWMIGAAIVLALVKFVIPSLFDLVLDAIVIGGFWLLLVASRKRAA